VLLLGLGKMCPSDKPIRTRPARESPNKPASSGKELDAWTSYRGYCLSSITQVIVLLRDLMHIRKLHFRVAASSRSLSFVMRL